MDIVAFPLDRLPSAMRALRAVVQQPSPKQERFLETLAALHGTSIDTRSLPPFPLWLVPICIPDRHQQKRLVQLAAVMVTIDGEVTVEAALAVEQLASMLGVREPAVRTLRRIAAKQTLRVRIELTRRIMKIVLGAAWREEGLRGVAKIVRSMVGHGSDPATAQRYAGLSRFPAGSVGRALWEHCERQGFPLPGGADDAIPERLLFHDVGHLLSGYRTDPEGEIQQAAFQAGFVRNDGFAFLFFGIVQFHLGIKVTPVAAPQRGFFDVEKVLVALARGAACEQDLSTRWDFWSVAKRPLAELRTEWQVSADNA